MKIFTLSLIAASIILALVIFIAFVYSVNSEAFTDIGGGPIDLDPDLSPSYAYDFTYRLDSIFVAGPILLGIIILILVIPHLILKKKKIPSRPYTSLIAAGIMLFLGIPNFLSISSFLYLMWEHESLQTFDILLSVIPILLLGLIGISLGIVILYKSQLIRKWIRK